MPAIIVFCKTLIFVSTLVHMKYRDNLKKKKFYILLRAHAARKTKQKKIIIYTSSSSPT